MKPWYAAATLLAEDVTSRNEILERLESIKELATNQLAMKIYAIAARIYDQSLTVLRAEGRDSVRYSQRVRDRVESDPCAAANHEFVTSLVMAMADGKGVDSLLGAFRDYFAWGSEKSYLEISTAREPGLWSFAAQPLASGRWMWFASTYDASGKSYTGAGGTKGAAVMAALEVAYYDEVPIGLCPGHSVWLEEPGNGS